MKRQIVSILIVLILLAGIPLQTLAATHEVGDFAGMETAFRDQDAEVTVNLTDDVTWTKSLTAGDGQTYTINGNGNTMTNVAIGGSGTVNIDADLEGVKSSYGRGGTALAVSGATVNVTGDITSEGTGINARHRAEVTVTGNVESGGSGVSAGGYADVTVNGNIESGTQGVMAEYGSTVTVNGDIDAGDNGISANADGDLDGSSENPQVTVNGDIHADRNGVAAYVADVTVNGDVEAKESGVATTYGNITVTGNITGGEYGVSAKASSVTVEGDVTSVETGVAATRSSVTVDGDVKSESTGVSVGDLAHVEITGDVEGTAWGIRADQGSATVHGNVSATRGTGVYAKSQSYVTVFGEVDAGITGISARDSSVYAKEVTAGLNGVQPEGDCTVLVERDITAGKNGIETTGGTTFVAGDVKAGENGIKLRRSYYSEELDVEVQGNVSGDAYGISVDYTRGKETGGLSGTVTVDGTVSGKTGSVLVTDESEEFRLERYPQFSLTKVSGGRGGVSSNLQGAEHEAVVDLIVKGHTDYGTSGEEEGTTPGGTNPGTGTNPGGTTNPGSGTNPGGTTNPGTGSNPGSGGDAEKAPDTGAAADMKFLPVTTVQTVDVPVVVGGEKAVIWVITEYMLKLLMQEHTGAVTFDCSDYAGVTSLTIPGDALEKLMESATSLEVKFASGTRTLTAAEVKALLAEGDPVVITLN